MKENKDIDEEIKISCPGEMEFIKLKTDIDSLGISLDSLILSPKSREVNVHIAGYTANKFKKKKKSRVAPVLKIHITGSIDIENPDDEYLISLNRGGLSFPSSNLVNYVFDAFPVLSATELLIKQSNLISRNASKVALSYMMRCCNFTCENH